MPRYIDALEIRYTYRPVGGDIAYKDEIEALPTADVAPVVHAHWVTEPYYDNNEEACYDILSCSHCNYPFTGDEYRFVKYHDKLCPYCGARMDEEVKL